MEKEKKHQMIDEIKRLERELYLKRSQLAAAEAMENAAGAGKGLDPQEWRQIFSQLIKDIGQLSTGGNSVEDIKMERER